MVSEISDVYLHRLSPFAIRFWGEFGIRWYGLAYLAGFVLAYLLVHWRRKRCLTALSAEQVGDFVFTVALGAIIGGRLGYCILYNPGLFLQFSREVPFWGVLAIHEGGMASHGGMLGMVISCIYFARSRHIATWHLLDLISWSALPGIFLGRIANFVNGELVGRPASAGISWAVKFPQDMLLWPSDNPAALFKLTPLVGEVGVSAVEWQSWLMKLAISKSAWLQVEGCINRLIEALQHGNEIVQAGIAPLLVARHPSQLYEALLEGLLLFVISSFIWRRERRPGLIVSLLLILYAIVRVFVEEFRMPDAQIGFQLWGLTRGQWLSVLMLICGLLCLWITQVYLQRNQSSPQSTEQG